jgi:hypothetical protein
MLIEVLEGSVKVVRHLDQTFGTPELPTPRRSLDRYEQDRLLVAIGNEDCLPPMSSVDQLKQSFLCFIEVDLFHLSVPIQLHGVAAASNRLSFSIYSDRVYAFRHFAVLREEPFSQGVDLADHVLTVLQLVIAERPLLEQLLDATQAAGASGCL